MQELAKEAARSARWAACEQKPNKRQVHTPWAEDGKEKEELLQAEQVSPAVPTGPREHRGEAPVKRVSSAVTTGPQTST